MSGEIAAALAFGFGFGMLVGVFITYNQAWETGYKLGSLNERSELRRRALDREIDNILSGRRKI